MRPTCSATRRRQGGGGKAVSSPWRRGRRAAPHSRASARPYPFTPLPREAARHRCVELAAVRTSLLGGVPWWLRVLGGVFARLGICHRRTQNINICQAQYCRMTMTPWLMIMWRPSLRRLESRHSPPTLSPPPAHQVESRCAEGGGRGGRGGLRWSPCDDDCDRPSSRLWLWRCAVWGVGPSGGRARWTASSCNPPGTGHPRGCCRRHPDRDHSMTRQDGAQDLVRVMTAQAKRRHPSAVLARAGRVLALGPGGVQRHCRTQSARTQRG